MGTNISHSHLTALLEEYIQQTQESFALDIAQATTPEKRKEKQLERKIMLWEVDCAKKYRLTQSALAMIERLKPDTSQASLATLPGTGIWIALDTPQQTNLFFSSIPLAASSYRETHPKTTLSPSLARLAGSPWQWTLDIMQMDARPRSYLYDSRRRQWTLNTVQQCPENLCEFTGYDATYWPGWYICEACKKTLIHWTNWFPVALMAIAGDFATEEVRQEPPQVKISERRKIPRSDGTGYEERKVTHTWHIITFDISVKSPGELREREAQEPAHPTWLERAIADETVVYVSRHIDQAQRTFRHERYTNMRGKTITVTDYDKRIPMSVKHLKHTIFCAIAQQAT